jgi:cell division protein FtsQ
MRSNAMRKLKVQPSRTRARTRETAQKRGSPSWKVETTLRRVWSNVFLKLGIVSGSLLLFTSLLWWAEYPQRFSLFVSNSMVSATGVVGFKLTDVLVEGRKNAPLETILKVVNVRRGNPLLGYDPYQIKKDLEEISWIRKATVKRQLPGLIFIQLNERQPVALWQHHQKHYIVDELGVIISTDNLQAFDKLPIIVGGDAPVHAPHILHLLEKFPDIRKQITALVRVGERRWDLHLDRTLQIKLPETNVEDALVRLDLLIKQKKVNPAQVSVVDLRVKSQMVIRLSPTAAVRLKGKGKET